MAYRGQESPLNTFTGGLASSKFSTTLGPDEAIDLKNIYINTSFGIEKRRGDTAFNSSAMVSGSTAITGLGAFKLDSGSEYIMAVAGTKIFQSLTSSGAMTDITGAVTVTSNQNNIWQIFSFNNNTIGVGGAPNSPWKWTGSGNAAALGGTPPAGSFGCQHNNRVFIGSTSADPSRIYWSTLGNGEDWSGDGSGNLYVWRGDGDRLVGSGILNDDIILLFKERSIHKMIGRSSPFPVYPLFKDTGAVGKNAIVVVDGVCYFITPRGRMKATDGNQIISFPDDIDDVWDSLNMTRLQYIQGQRYTGNGFDHLVWAVSSSGSSTNDFAIVWDLVNKCWLRHTTGYKCNVMTKTQDGTLYGGHYDGKVYKKDVLNTYSDASETSPGAIDGFWRTGWNSNNTYQITFHPFRLNLGLVSQLAGSLVVTYGFDFNQDLITETIDMRSGGAIWDSDTWDQSLWGGQLDLVSNIFLAGRGNVFQISFRNNVAGETFKIHGYTLAGKPAQQKTFVAV